MKIYIVVLLIIPFLVYAEDFDQSSPLNTYESCVVNQHEPLAFDFFERFLNDCITKERKIYEVQSMILLAELPSLLKKIPEALSEEEFEYTPKTEKILKSYFEYEDKVSDSQFKNLSDQNLDALALDLFNHLEAADLVDSFVVVDEMVETIFFEDIAKGILLSTNSLVPEENEIFFRKIDSKWLIEIKLNSD